MKMPNEAIDPAMFAPCGMNCLVCYRHCRPKKPCAGCRGGDSGNGITVWTGSSFVGSLFYVETLGRSCYTNYGIWDT